MARMAGQDKKVVIRSTYRKNMVQLAFELVVDGVVVDWDRYIKTAAISDLRVTNTLTALGIPFTREDVFI